MDLSIVIVNWNTADFLRRCLESIRANPPAGEVEVPGLWEIYAQERLADRFAVHIPADEPDLTPVSPSRLEALFKGARVRVVGPGEPLAEAVLEQRHGRELWRMALGLALVLMMAEMLVARTERTQRASA